jgi:Na+/H+-dicarboxylate symporter
MGIDQFLDMGRSATNVVGNSIATCVVGKWEGEYNPKQHEEMLEGIDDPPEQVAQPA